MLTVHLAVEGLQLLPALPWSSATQELQLWAKCNRRRHRQRFKRKESEWGANMNMYVTVSRALWIRYTNICRDVYTYLYMVRQTKHIYTHPRYATERVCTIMHIYIMLYIKKKKKLYFSICLHVLRCIVAAASSVDMWNEDLQFWNEELRLVFCHASQFFGGCPCCRNIQEDRVVLWTKRTRLSYIYIYTHYCSVGVYKYLYMNIYTYIIYKCNASSDVHTPYT